MTRRPPGPRDLVFGLRLARRFSRDPLPFLNELVRDYGDIAMFRLGPYRACLVNCPDLIQRVLVADRHVFPKHPRHCHIIRGFSGDSVFVTDGDDWLRQRRLVQPAFHANRMERYAAATVAQTQRLLRGWSPGKEIDLVGAMAELALTGIAQALFDVDVSQRVAELGKALRIHAKTLRNDFRSAVLLPDWLPIASKRQKRWAVRCLGGLVWQMIRERRATGDDHGDVLSMLLLAKDEQGDGGRMTDQQAHDEAMIMLIAGQDDTTAALSWCWCLLARHPEVEARFRQEVAAVVGDRAATYADVARLPYTEMIIKETMRLYPPTWSLVPRRAAQDHDLGGYRIPRGTWVFVSPYATHHDARYFPEPERFDPERFSSARHRQMAQYTYIPFGGGPRMCIGNHYTLATMSLALATIAQRYRLTPLVDLAAVRPDPSLALRPRGGLRVRLDDAHAPAAPHAATGASRRQPIVAAARQAT
jgi:cytochrome P450